MSFVFKSQSIAKQWFDADYAPEQGEQGQAPQWPKHDTGRFLCATACLRLRLAPKRHEKQAEHIKRRQNRDCDACDEKTPARDRTLSGLFERLRQDGGSRVKR